MNDDRLSFVDALATFVSYWTRLKHYNDETITFEELVGGLIGVLASAIEQCDEEQREQITEAVHRALDDRLQDPHGKAREALN